MKVKYSEFEKYCENAQRVSNRDNDILDANLIKYNIPDNETRSRILDIIIEIISL